MIWGKFPQTRLRRLRNSPAIRRMVAETHLDSTHLVWPLFICEGKAEQQPIEAMPGVFRHSIDKLPSLAEQALRLGIPALALFPQTPPERKTQNASEAWNPQNLICRALHLLKRNYPELMVICDVALDPYNADGHDGLVVEGEIVNDLTLEALGRQALAQAEAGADTLAPSDMMDGRIGYLRDLLDKAGYQDVRLLSYAVKYASAFYGPFREAVGSGGLLKGDKKTYQMDSANRHEALREAALDVREGADLLMVKPGLPYLDVIRELASQQWLPVCAYQVSGEYAMIKAAAAQGWLDEDKAILESLMALRRAGAQAIFTYFADRAASLLRNQASP